MEPRNLATIIDRLAVAVIGVVGILLVLILVYRLVGWTLSKLIPA